MCNDINAVSGTWKRMGFAARLLALPVIFWRVSGSLLFPNRCRFAPSCSVYALVALAEHGPLKGCWLTVKRLARCHPWGGYGYDPVPSRKC